MFYINSELLCSLLCSVFIRKLNKESKKYRRI